MALAFGFCIATTSRILHWLTGSGRIRVARGASVMEAPTSLGPLGLPSTQHRRTVSQGRPDHFFRTSRGDCLPTLLVARFGAKPQDDCIYVREEQLVEPGRVPNVGLVHLIHHALEFLLIR
jgi:hypothetical protein